MAYIVSISMVPDKWIDNEGKCVAPAVLYFKNIDEPLTINGFVKVGGVEAIVEMVKELDNYKTPFPELEEKFINNYDKTYRSSLSGVLPIITPTKEQIYVISRYGIKVLKTLEQEVNNEYPNKVSGWDRIKWSKFNILKEIVYGNNIKIKPCGFTKSDVLDVFHSSPISPWECIKDFVEEIK